MERLFKTAGVTPDIVARADSTEMVRSLVGAGAGLAVLNMRPLTETSYGGDALTALPIADDVPGLRLLSGRLKGKPRRLITEFLDRLHTWMDHPNANHLVVNA